MHASGLGYCAGRCGPIMDKRPALSRSARRFLLPLLLLLVLLAGCRDTPSTIVLPRSSLATLPGTWVVYQVDTQTVAPFVTSYSCSPTTGRRWVSELLAESLTLDSLGGVRRRLSSRRTGYQDTVLVDTPTVSDFVSVGSFAPTTAYVVGPAEDSAVALYLGPQPGMTGAVYTVYLQRVDSLLLYRMSMGSSCTLPLVGGDRLARFSRH
jgi:hypothetical protein